MLKSAIASLTVLAAAGCSTVPTPASIPDTAARNPQLSTLAKLIGDAGLADTLRGPGPYTVFAPNDAAFAALPAQTRDELARDKERLKAVLTYHVLAGRIASTQAPNGQVKTVQGSAVSIARAGSFVTIDEAVVQTPDIAATNGVVHVIDRVLLPPRR